MTKSSESELKDEINEISKTIDTILKNIESEREKLHFTDSNSDEIPTQKEKTPNGSEAKEVSIPSDTEDNTTEDR